MLFISGIRSEPYSKKLPKFQSRNRDAFHFRVGAPFVLGVSPSSFQSRNRDAFHFRSATKSSTWNPFGFNLAIEMLFISGKILRRDRHSKTHLFQSRNRDAFHFRVPPSAAGTAASSYVSISQSRCFSFQGKSCNISSTPFLRFNLAIEMLFISGGHRGW